MRKVEFPIIEGVEVRTFGDPNKPMDINYRCVKAVFERSNEPSHNSPRFHLGGRLMIIDDEQGGMLVPRVSGFVISNGSGGMLFGRLRRSTRDHIKTIDDADFSKGYVFAVDQDSVERDVSEQFMLTDVLTLDKAAFDAMEADAAAKFNALNSPELVATAWGHAGPAHHAKD